MKSNQSKTNSTNGTTNMDRKTLSSRNIREIIAAGSKHKISRLKFGDLEIFFTPEEKVPMTIKSDKAISEAQHEQNNKDQLEFDELAAKQEKLEMALIENPSLYEKLALEGELLDADDDYDSGDEQHD